MPPAGTSNRQQHLLSPSLTKPMFTFPGLSQALQTNMDGQGGGENLYSNLIGTTKEDEYDGRSGSDNMDGGSESDDGKDDDNPPKKKRYHRHTPQQIQELDALFEECQHPDEKQRMEFSRRLSLESRQVKFWFQNRRTQMKTQLKRYENLILREENEKLHAKNMSIRDAMRNMICDNCGGPEMLRDVSLQKQNLRIENARIKNARLKVELDHVCAFKSKFMG